MPVVRLLPAGLSGGFPPSALARRGGRRGQVVGWSAGAARRNMKFLWSIDTAALGGSGWAVTLTVGDTPADSDVWAHARSLWLERLRKRGMVRYHWVTEWTAKGRPHLHAAVYTDDVTAVATMLVAWLEIADSNGWPASTRAQHIAPIQGLDGWLKYVSKHASRGVTHYQHQGAPEGWTKTGKLWGYGGDWPIEEEQLLEMGDKQFLLFRRKVWDWMLQDMHARRVDPEFIEKTRIRWANPEHGNHHGISGWIPALVAYQIYLDVLDAEEPDFVWERR